MAEKYKIHDNSKAYFITMTTVGWVRKQHRKVPDGQFGRSAEGVGKISSVEMNNV